MQTRVGQGRLSTRCSPALVARRRSSGGRGLLSQLTKRLVERAPDVERADHLGCEHLEPPGGAGNRRNGSSPKSVSTQDIEAQPAEICGVKVGRDGL
jgi:transposase-like protein